LLLLIWFLIFIATSAQAPKTKRGKKKGANAAASSDEESGAERTHDEDATRPKSRRVTRANPDADTAEEGTGDERAPVTPNTRPRPRPKATFRHKTPEVNDEGEPSQPGSPLGALTPSEGPVEAEEIQTPRASLKRPRTDEEEDAAPNGAADIDAEGTPDIQVRRKRIRH
jgi:cohesin complex subunit SA-1/2